MLDLPEDPHLAEPAEPAEPTEPTEPTVSTQPGLDVPRPSPAAPAEDEAPNPSGTETEPGEDVGTVQRDPAAQMMNASGDPPPSPSPVESADAGVAAPPPDAASPLAACPTSATLGPNDRCYAGIATTLTWDDARLECQSIGAGWDLAVVRDADQNAFVAGLMNVEAWLGGSDGDVEGRWSWVGDEQPFWNGSGDDGAAVDDAFENWNSDEPNGGGPSDCLRLVAGRGTWADLECSFERPAVCEGPAQ